ncbi:hypothetical protein GCK32_016931 [Trichostrongylus colubriformis]|uniref:Uncharacterized protein n=1 Tax=Trichostrongylus colubriformis TaxID=6319 RepID=A0AAN8EWT8_TRICO
MTMKQILLAILVGIVSIGASFIDTDYEEELNGVSQHRIVSNDYCKYSEVKVQPFREITNSSLRSFLLDKLGLIANTDCVQSYQVKTKDDSSPFYVFRIDRQTKFLRSFSVCGVRLSSYV